MTIASGFLTGDTLNFTTTERHHGSYSNGVLTLTGNATVEQYQAALDSVSYSFSPINSDPTGGGSHTTRTISWTVTDGATSHNTATGDQHARHRACRPGRAGRWHRDLHRRKAPPVTLDTT